MYDYYLRITNIWEHIQELSVIYNIIKARESVTENIKTSATRSFGYSELQQHRPQFGKECSKFLGQMKGAKWHCLQNSCQINGDDVKSMNFKILGLSGRIKETSEK
jgi:hypothetical protein